MADKLEKELSSGTDAAYVRGIDANGNSIQISKADLATVIGSLIPYLPLMPETFYTGDFNDLVKSGIYYYNNFSAPGFSNSPGANYGFVFSLVYESMRIQLGFIAGSAPNMFFRLNYDNTAWSEWKSIA